MLSVWLESIDWTRTARKRRAKLSALLVTTGVPALIFQPPLMATRLVKKFRAEIQSRITVVKWTLFLYGDDLLVFRVSKLK